MQIAPISMKKMSGLILILLGAFFWMGLAQNPKERAQEESLTSKSPLIEETRSLIKKHYPGDVDERKLVDGAVDGMLKSLDSFSEHLNRREYQEIQNEVKGEFGGIGLVVAIRGDYPRVIKVLPRSPAELAGIRETDEVVGIDGESTFRKPVFYIIERLRGPLGSRVTVTVRRKATRQEIDITLKRTKIIVESVRETRLIPPDTGYLKLMEFVENTRGDLDRALKQLKGEGARRLVLDLRNNMGGTLESAIEIAQKFLPRGSLIVKTSGKLKEDQSSYFADGKNADTGVPITVLVNRLTASASEIVAGALKDNGRAQIVGEKTFGKGSVQTVFPLSDGSAIRLTTAHYVTPKGSVIDKKGVEPDIGLVFPDEVEQMKELAAKRDSILDQTLEMIHGKKTQA